MIDTLIVIVMLATPINTTKQFSDEAFRCASENAHNKALEATKSEREKLLNFDDVFAIVDELKRNRIKTR